MGLHVELQEGVAEVVTLFPDVRPVSATLGFYAPGASTPKVSPAVTVAAVNTTVAAVGATPDVVTLASVTGIGVHDEVWYSSQSGWSAKARVANIADKVVTFDSPLLATPSVGDTVRGLKCSASIGSGYTSPRGKDYRLAWSVTDDAGQVRNYRREAAVVATKFRDPVTPDDAVRVAADLSPGWAKVQTAGRWRRLAERSSEDVRMLLEAEEDWPWLIGDHEAFGAAGEVALRVRLAELGIAPQGYDVADYRRDYERKLEPEVRKAIAGCWVDRNDNQAVDQGEVRARSTVHIRRE